MSRDSDIAEMGRAMKEHRKLVREESAEVNLRAINDAGLKHTYRGADRALLFREQGKPRCDFYLPSGKWCDLRTGKFYGRGAAKFLEWYGKQHA